MEKKKQLNMLWHDLTDKNAVVASAGIAQFLGMALSAIKLSCWLIA